LDQTQKIVSRPSHDDRKEGAEGGKGQRGLTIGELSDDLKTYIAKHLSQYKDQVNPPRRLDPLGNGTDCHMLRLCWKPSIVYDG